MYFLILKKKKDREEKDRKKTKGYTDMYVQPNIGTPLKQTHRRLWQDERCHTQLGDVSMNKKAWGLDWFGKKEKETFKDKQALISFFLFFFVVFSLQ